MKYNISSRVLIFTILKKVKLTYNRAAHNPQNCFEYTDYLQTSQDV
jgi:hypothetical protein